jgi:hypothetical protein
MKLVSVKQTPAGSKKKLIAIFDDGKVLQFGSKGSQTYAEGAPEQKKNAYLLRHKVNEDWSSHTPAALSRWVLWSAKSISEGIKNYNKNVKN